LTRQHPKRSASARGYNYRWQQARLAFLRAHPLCQCPHCDEGRLRVTPATVVDHKVPHKGNSTLFWDRTNWQALSKQCHDSYKQRLEGSGRITGCDASGIPLDQAHHWHQRIEGGE
jgi:5-methylcytosine-specific restriction protein A